MSTLNWLALLYVTIVADLELDLLLQSRYGG